MSLGKNRHQDVGQEVVIADDALLNLAFELTEAGREFFEFGIELFAGFHVKKDGKGRKERDGPASMKQERVDSQSLGITWSFQILREAR